VLPQIKREFEQGGFKAYEDALMKGEIAEDQRIPTRFWGVDWKNGETKSLVWNLIRIIADMHKSEHDINKAWPIKLGYLGETPSSIKNANKQFEFAQRYLRNNPIS